MDIKCEHCIGGKIKRICKGRWVDRPRYSIGLGECDECKKRYMVYQDQNDYLLSTIEDIKFILNIKPFWKKLFNWRKK